MHETIYQGNKDTVYLITWNECIHGRTNPLEVLSWVRHFSIVHGLRIL